ncbi:MAG: hypothetical protein CL840_18685, partial [Crocinitomicaceae bacterium]|nr:hypothetical protein [Crocinitomicaceae bacterium]
MSAKGRKLRIEIEKFKTCLECFSFCFPIILGSLFFLGLSNKVSSQSVIRISTVKSDSINKVMGVSYGSTGKIMGLSTGSSTTNNSAWSPSDDWFDVRDSTVYGTVKIGNQTWMTKNLIYDSPVGNTYWYNNDSSTNYSYGKLYTHAAAMNGYRISNAYPSDVQGACPAGWHLPSQLEWDTLLHRTENTFVSGNTNCGTCGSLKDSTLNYWSSPNTGAVNEFAMEIQGGGYYSGSNFSGLKINGYFWTSSFNLSSTSTNNFNYFSYNNDNAIITSTSSSTIAYSIRCIKNLLEADAGEDQTIASGVSTVLDANENVVPEFGFWTIISGIGGSVAIDTAYNSIFIGMADSSYLLQWAIAFEGDTVRDTVKISFSGNNKYWEPGDGWLDTRDNEMYKTVKIGNQTWMAENLRYNIHSTSDFYSGDSATYRDFGRLYTKSKALDGGRVSQETPGKVQGACPVSWHLPSVGEFDTLIRTIKSSHTDESSCTTCGGELKEATTLYWSQPNTASNNSTGFTAKGAGYYSGSTYSGIYTNAYYWTASYPSSNPGNQAFYYLSYNNDQIIYTSTNSASIRYSIRCVKDVPIAYAGPDQKLTSDTVTLLAADSAVLPQVGYWTIISGGG